jgi:hypothetical protein
VASKRRPAHLCAGAGILCALLVAGCSGAERRFPLRDPLWQDTDQRPVSVDCEPRPTDKDKQHRACAPDPYVSPLAWDAADNSFFRPLAQVFAVDPSRPAPNVNAFDEVPDSAWFTNRLGKKKPSRAELLQGACTEHDLLDGATAVPGSWVIDQGKPNGATPGFRIKIAGKYKFLLKTDNKAEPERPTAASAIGAALYHAAGFNTSCEQIVYFDPSVLSLKPGLEATDNSGITKAFDQHALARVLGQAGQRGKLVRMQASAWLPGYLIGPFRYESVRSDDPNDAIPHEDRRDLRGARVLAAWLNHFDAREQNTMDSWISSDAEAPDSSPGYVRHFYLDTSDTLGSLWDWDEISRRLGRSYLLDFGDMAVDFVTLGAIERPWERVQRTPGGLFGYFHYRDFEPDAWKNEYPNPAFSSADEHDKAWMTRILSRLDRDDIDALVSLGKFTRAQDATFLAEVLEQRLERIASRYFAYLSPLADPRLEPGNKLCLTDLFRRRAHGSTSFRYQARLGARGAERELPVEVHDAGEVCLVLPHLSPEGGVKSDDPSRYVVVGIDNGQARHALGVHLYDLGPESGFRVVGLERPELGLTELMEARP